MMIKLYEHINLWQTDDEPQNTVPHGTQTHNYFLPFSKKSKIHSEVRFLFKKEKKSGTH